MRIDFQAQEPPEGPVVRLANCGVQLLPQYDTAVEGVSFELNRGDLAVMRLEPGVVDHPLVDVLCGLVPVTSGEIRIFGGDWRDWGADEQAGARSRIGRVFAGQGWMSNLDVDENVTLSVRYHTGIDMEGAVAEANRIARVVGLDALPEGRPSVVERHKLRRAEWVRAALCRPWLALIEYPGRELPGAWMTDFRSFVELLRGQGTAVLWLCENDAEWNAENFNPSLKLSSVGNTLTVEKTR